MRNGHSRVQLQHRLPDQLASQLHKAAAKAGGGEVAAVRRRRRAFVFAAYGAPPASFLRAVPPRPALRALAHTGPIAALPSVPLQLGCSSLHDRASCEVVVPSSNGEP